VVAYLVGGRGSAMVAVISACGLAAGAAGCSAVMVVVGVLEEVVADLEFDGAAMTARFSLSLDEHDDHDDQRCEDEHCEHRRRYPERHCHSVYRHAAQTASRYITNKRPTYPQRA